MKKTLKITLISLGSLLGIIILGILMLCWLVLTPARLTAIVRNQAPNFISCNFELEKADLTLVKSFPKVGLKIDNVLLENPMNESPSDTLAYLNECVVSVDIKKFLKENQIIVEECRLYDGYVNIFINDKGETNIDIFPPSDPDTITEESEFNYGIDLKLLKLNNVSINYTDLTQSMFADINDLDLMAKASMRADNISGQMDLSLRGLSYQQMIDSMSMFVNINDLKINGDANMIGDDVKADIKASSSAFIYESGDQIADFSSFSFKYKGDVKDYNIINGNAEMALNEMSFNMKDEQLLDHANMRLIMPLNADLNNMNFDFGASQIAINNILVDIIGNVSMPTDDILIDLNLKTNTLIVEELIELIPDSMREELLAGIDVKGELKLAAEIKGLYNDSTLPVVNADVMYNKGFVSMPELLPNPITDFNTSLIVDFNTDDKSDLRVNYLNANMMNSSLSISGDVFDFMNMDKIHSAFVLKANADLDQLQSFIPEGIEAHGDVNVNINARVSATDLVEMMTADIRWNDMNVVYSDTINVLADNLKVNVTMPNENFQLIDNSLAIIEISGDNMNAAVSEMLQAGLENYNIKAQISNVLDENIPLSVVADYSFSRIDAAMDDMKFFANDPNGTLAILSQGNDETVSYSANYKGDSLSFVMGDEMAFLTENIDFNVTAKYDENQEDILLQWNPHAGIKLNNAVFSTEDIALPIHIPTIVFKYDTTGVEINDSRVILGDSDFNLKGYLSNVDEYIRKEDVLKGKLDFVSKYTNISQIMELFSGMGDTTLVVDNEQVTQDTISTESEPFMVPLGVDVTLNTLIENAVTNEMQISNIGGELIVKNGILVLREMGFTNDAATMMLTAMYKSARKNHLYLGMDLRLLDINIAEMINLIPEIDTLVPMLKSFDGNAEFHFAVETYLKSNYDPKISTLKGALAIHGKDLVVLDNDTFRKLAKMLRFNDKEHNKIDELSVEMTAFKSEIDVYPTLIKLDKYHAVVGGRHKIDMTFDYRLGISNPWPFRKLGIIVKGEEDIKYRFTFKKNLDLDDPKGKSEDVHLIEQSLRLKKMIYDSLTEGLNR